MQHENAPHIITNVTYGIFSISRHYGGCTAYGTSYFYVPPQDALVRKDLMKHMKKRTWIEFIEHLKTLECNTKK